MRYLAILLLAVTAFACDAFGQAPLRPSDSFELQLNGPPLEYASDFRGVYTVGSDGMVSIPLIGPMRAAGLSPNEFARAVEKKLIEEKIFTNPTILLNLPMQTRFVTVGGAVRAPQAVPWSGDLTLSSAIKRAGGGTEFANYKHVRVTRDGETRVFDLRPKSKARDQNIKLLPGDEVELSE